MHWLIEFVGHNLTGLRSRVMAKLGFFVQGGHLLFITGRMLILNWGGGAGE